MLKSVLSNAVMASLVLSSITIGLTPAGVKPAAAEPAASLHQLSLEVMQRQTGGDHKGAIKLAISLTKRVKNEFGPTHIQYALALNNLALLHDEQDRPYDAVPVYARAIKIIAKHHKSQPAALGMMLNNMASAVFAQCRLEDAEQLFERATLAYARLLPATHPDRLAIDRNLQKVRTLLGKTAKGQAAHDATRTYGHTAVVGNQTDTVQLPRACSA
ncbi:MAG: tetratricopeptide repeat protein [Pseudomonadota bacterium]